MLDIIEGRSYMDFYLKIFNTMLPMACPDLMDGAVTPARKIQSYQKNEKKERENVW